MKYILIDIDGVLVPNMNHAPLKILKDKFYVFKEESVRILNKLIDDETTLVLISSHRFRFSTAKWKNIFLARGVNVKGFYINKLHHNKVKAITHWFECFPNNSLLIDDEVMVGNYHKPNQFVGLCENDYKDIIKHYKI